MLSRSEYLKAYYRANKDKYKQNYNAQRQYIRYVEIKKLLSKLKKEIGNQNYNLILDELEKLPREKY